MISKELLERASFLHILKHQFEAAIPLQEKLCALNKKLYQTPFQKGSNKFLSSAPSTCRNVKTQLY